MVREKYWNFILENWRLQIVPIFSKSIGYQIIYFVIEFVTDRWQIKIDFNIQEIVPIYDIYYGK